VVLERDGDDETQVRYTHEGGSLYDDLLSQRRDGASYDYLLDGLASVKQIVDSSQAVENSYSYEAFGQATVGQSDVANPYLFVGGFGVQWESTPGLYFMQARYYSPGVGRFISEDPYGGSPQDPLSLHRYLYCGNGPVTVSDPSGSWWWHRDNKNEPLAECWSRAWNRLVHCMLDVASDHVWLLVGTSVGCVVITALTRAPQVLLYCVVVGAMVCESVILPEQVPCTDQYQKDRTDCFEKYGDNYMIEH
jgi:RHS repeat-associated protein